MTKEKNHGPVHSSVFAGSADSDHHSHCAAASLIREREWAHFYGACLNLKAEFDSSELDHALTFLFPANALAI
jgi:hypothetical protein